MSKCLYCGVALKPNRTYCSVTHQISFQNERYVERWLNNEEPGGTKYGPTRMVRVYIYGIKGIECWECGWKEINKRTGKCPVQIDHIDGDAMNNRLDNLRLLCPNCHSLTPTYGNTGKKSTRTYRYPKS